MSKNRFLSLIEKMAKARNQSVEEFAKSFRYKPEGVQFLRDHYWFNPTRYHIYIIFNKVDLELWEEEKLERLADSSAEQKPADATYEMIQIMDRLPEECCAEILEEARRQIELFYCIDLNDLGEWEGPYDVKDDFKRCEPKIS